MRRPALPKLGATSVNQIIVSTASIWQKNGRMLLKWWPRQYCSSLAVSGVTPQSLGFGKVRHWSTWPRISFTIAAASYCCSRVERSLPSSKTNSSCWEAPLLLRLGLGIGVKKSAPRRPSMIPCVGCPFLSSQCLAGYSYGEFKIGLSKNWFDIVISCSPWIPECESFGQYISIRFSGQMRQTRLSVEQLPSTLYINKGRIRRASLQCGRTGFS